MDTTTNHGARRFQRPAPNPSFEPTPLAWLNPSPTRAPRMKRIFLNLLILCGVPGCASVYQQPGIKLDSSMDMAVIEDDPCANSQCLIVLKIDGQRRGIGWFRRYELQPGLRTIELAFGGVVPNGQQMTHAGSTSNVVVEFEARPGTTYVMRANAGQGSLSWRPEIIEKTSGAVVSRQLMPGIPQETD
jgi:hypothetical protein